MKSFLANWKTTALGVGGALTALGHLLTQFGSGTFDGSMIMIDLITIMNSLGLIVAKDGNVTGGSVRQ